MPVSPSAHEMQPLLLRNVVYAGEATDLLVTGAGVFPGPHGEIKNAEAHEGHGLRALPGVMDVHVHFRDPGLTEKEDLLTGARAAAAGGFTTVLCEPNTRPVIDTPEAVTEFARRVEELEIPLHVFTKAAVTRGQGGEALTDIHGVLAAGAAALSDDGEPLVDEHLLRKASMASPAVITAHCEETPRSAERVRSALGDGPAMTQEAAIIRMHLRTLEGTSGRLHIQHVSLAESAVLIAEAKRRGLAVTAEVTPHHLLLCADDIPSRDGEPDANWKMNPPLRSREDMLAMRRALAEGVVDMLATDHAPHTPAEKARGWADAPFGIIGLETALGACLSLMHDGTLTWARLQDALCAQPGRLVPLAPKDGVTLIDPDAEWVVEPSEFYSRGRNCPFAGTKFRGRPLYTFARGRLVMAEGEVLF